MTEKFDLYNAIILGDGLAILKYLKVVARTHNTKLRGEFARVYSVEDQIHELYLEMRVVKDYAGTREAFTERVVRLHMNDAESYTTLCMLMRNLQSSWLKRTNIHKTKVAALVRAALKLSGYFTREDYQTGGKHYASKYWGLTTWRNQPKPKLGYLEVLKRTAELLPMKTVYRKAGCQANTQYVVSGGDSIEFLVSLLEACDGFVMFEDICHVTARLTPIQGGSEVDLATAINDLRQKMLRPDQSSDDEVVGMIMHTVHVDIVDLLDTPKATDVLVLARRLTEEVTSLVTKNTNTLQRRILLGLVSLHCVLEDRSCLWFKREFPHLGGKSLVNTLQRKIMAVVVQKCQEAGLKREEYLDFKDEFRLALTVKIAELRDTSPKSS